jgi:hypothetical protein
MIGATVVNILNCLDSDKPAKSQSASAMKHEARLKERMVMILRIFHCTLLGPLNNELF